MASWHIAPVDAEDAAAALRIALERSTRLFGRGARETLDCLRAIELLVRLKFTSPEADLNPVSLTFRPSRDRRDEGLVVLLNLSPLTGALGWVQNQLHSLVLVDGASMSVPSDSAGDRVFTATRTQVTVGDVVIWTANPSAPPVPR
ncbi:MAG TPA: hypothetical protein VMS08_03780 [Candidatus Saccharimonadia bacterium]|jgi:hypothetical protein|nr:hypothetical protein [Candidatus Saccharimonadia bacterium]